MTQVSRGKHIQETGHHGESSAPSPGRCDTASGPPSDTIRHDRPVSTPTDDRKTHLTASDWVDAAMDVMTGGSESDVKIERIAVRLKASKGSFYWHFKDRRHLLSAVLERWMKRTTLDVQARLEHQERAPEQRLLRFLELPLKSGRAIAMANLELTILNWARQDEAAREALERVDQLRTAHIRSLIIDLGISEGQADNFAHEAYAMIRYVALRRDIPAESRSVLINALHQRIISTAK